MILGLIVGLAVGLAIGLMVAALGRAASQPTPSAFDNDVDDLFVDWDWPTR